MREATCSVTRDGLDWPELRREILANGGIGPSPDWPRDWYPADLYRANGRPPDMVAAETFIGTADRAPWQSGELAGDDAAMFAYLRRSYEDWRRTLPPCEHEHYSDESARACAERVTRAPRAGAATVSVTRTKTGTRSYADLVAELQRKHGVDVDLSGLRGEYVSAYESGERVTVEHDGRTFRGTVGATRGPVPRFVLLVSLPL